MNYRIFLLTLLFSPLFAQEMASPRKSLCARIARCCVTCRKNQAQIDEYDREQDVKRQERARKALDKEGEKKRRAAHRRTLRESNSVDLRRVIGDPEGFKKAKAFRDAERKKEKKRQTKTRVDTPALGVIVEPIQSPSSDPLFTGRSKLTQQESVQLQLTQRESTTIRGTPLPSPMPLPGQSQPIQRFATHGDDGVTVEEV